MRVFSETQKFDQWWMKLLYLCMVALLLYSLNTWYIAHETVNKVGATDRTGQLIGTAVIILVLLLFYLFKLTTEIDEIGVHYQCLPFHLSRRTVRWADMDACYVRTYSPIREYGGWGFRVTRGNRGKAFNVKGNKGIQMQLKTGKNILIGTQREADAKIVIRRNFRKYERI